MPSNWRQFQAFLSKVANEYPASVYMPRFRRIAFRILQLSVQNSPTNTGQLRNGWHVTIGSPSRSDVKSGDGAPAVLAAGSAVINGVEFGQGLWLQNNVPHAPVIEFGLYDPPDPGPTKAKHVPKSRRARLAGEVLVKGGFHVSAPNGMLGDAVAQVTAEIGGGQL